MKIATKLNILFIFLALSLTSCYKEVEFVSLESAKLDIKDNTGYIILTAKMHNPNFYSIQIEKSDIDVFINNNHLGLISSDQNIKLPANKETIIEIPIAVNLLDLVLNIPNIWSLFRQDEITLKFYGTINGKTLFGSKQFKIAEDKTIFLKN